MNEKSWKKLMKWRIKEYKESKQSLLCKDEEKWQAVNQNNKRQGGYKYNQL